MLYGVLLRCLLSGLLMLAGCEGDTARLVVEVRTDLVPGAEFDVVRAVLGETSDTVQARGQDFVNGVRIAEFEGLSEGRKTLRVVLSDAAGAPLAVGVKVVAA